MIPRYDKPEISQLWTDEYKYSRYLDVELAILEALEGEKVPAGVAQKIRETAKINPARVDEIEKITRHDVIAFCTSITEQLPTELGKFFHFGVTSSDVIDSALTLQVKASLEVVIPALEKLCEALKTRALETKDILAMGRSHGMYAEPLSFGQKLLSHYNEFQRRLADYKAFFTSELTVQFSGAVGNYTILTPDHEERAAKTLGLQVEPLSTQVIPRDRLAKLISLGGLTGAAIERLCVEIRHLHRSEVFELHEGFAKGQKGSSTMPHKKNPISGENLTGMARMLKSHVGVALDNVVLWHERDISHSSAERMMLPDHFGILFYSLSRLEATVNNLVFHKETIEGRVESNFIYLSSYYLHYLIEHTNLSREDLYALVQTAAFQGQKENSREVFHQTLSQDLATKGYKLGLPAPSFEEVRKIYTKGVDKIFARSL